MKVSKFTVPSVVPGATPQLSEDQNLQGAFPWYAINVVNPCSIIDDLFLSDVPIYCVDILIKDSEADSKLGKICLGKSLWGKLEG